LQILKQQQIGEVSLLQCSTPPLSQQWNCGKL